jgi:hypothetical protein
LNDPVQVIADASPYGLGTVLIMVIEAFLKENKNFT